MLERDIEAYLVAQVEARGGTCEKIKFIGRRGAPDRLVTLPGGETWRVELKKRGGRLSYHQKEYADSLPDGALYAVLWSIYDVDCWLAQL